MTHASGNVAFFGNFNFWILRSEPPECRGIKKEVVWSIEGATADRMLSDIDWPLFATIVAMLFLRNSEQNVTGNDRRKPLCNPACRL